MGEQLFVRVFVENRQSHSGGYRDPRLPVPDGLGQHHAAGRRPDVHDDGRRRRTTHAGEQLHRPLQRRPVDRELRGREPRPLGRAQIGTAPDIKVVGVTSWGTSDPNAPKDNYSSQFRQNAAYPTVDYGGYGGGNIGS